MEINIKTFYKGVLILCLMLLMLCVFNLIQASAQNCEDKVELNATSTALTRGKSFFSIKPEYIHKLAETENKVKKTACYVKISNPTAFDVNVFIDSVYVGYIEPGKQGYYQPKANYKTIHCWSSAGNIRWQTQGSCTGCMKHVTLRYKSHP